MNVDEVIDIKALYAVPQQPQVQCSALDQLGALYAIANRFGLYDAADIVLTVAAAAQE